MSAARTTRRKHSGDSLLPPRALEVFATKLSDLLRKNGIHFAPKVFALGDTAARVGCRTDFEFAFLGSGTRRGSVVGAVLFVELNLFNSDNGWILSRKTALRPSVSRSNQPSQAIAPRLHCE